MFWAIVLAFGMVVSLLALFITTAVLASFVIAVFEEIYKKYFNNNLGM
jgi:hypothetical protein